MLTIYIAGDERYIQSQNFQISDFVQELTFLL